jgi:hypothetical protein
MALPIIAAGVAARYGAKKLAKKLIKRAAKKKKNPNINRQEQNMADDNFGNTINMGPSRTQLKKQSERVIKKQVKQVEKKYNQPYPSSNTGFAAGEKLTRAKNAAKIAGKMSPY